MILKVKRVHKDAIVPKYVHSDDAGMDLFCVEQFSLKPSERKSVPTGIAMEIPEGHVGLVWDKSGISHKQGVKTTGGVIDAGYRGEICIGLVNLSSESVTFEKGHKIAQILIQKVEHPKIIEATELSDSVRGEKGFGSTGK
jgi:dUTP pyrophosphatase